MFSTDYTTEETEYYSSSSPSEGSGDPFRLLNSIPLFEKNSIPSSDSDDDSGHESESLVSSPKIQKIKQHQQKQGALPPSSFTNGSAFGDEETADARRKRRRVQGNSGVPEPPTKKKMTVQHSEEFPVKGHNKTQKQKVTGDASTSKEEEEARKQIDVETAGASKAKKEVQKQSFAEIGSGSEEKKKQKQIVAENGNTSKETKKVQKQNVVESVRPPSSAQHSTKKSSQHWSPADELAFFHGVLSYSKRGKGLPSNMAPVYDYVRPSLSTQYNNSQLYNKFRWGRTKFHSITAKIEVNNYSFKKNKYEFDNSHQAALYKFWVELWGKEDKGGAEHGNYVEPAVSASGNFNGNKKQHTDAEEGNASVGCKGEKKKDVEAEEEDAHKIRGEEDQRQQEEDGEDVLKSKKTLSKLKGEDTTISRELYNQFCEERDATLKELKSVVQKIFENTHSEVKAMLEGRLHQQLV